jgi:type IV pilus assembly protein PilM
MLQALSRLVPPPTYLTLPCAGVDVSDTSLKYVSFSHSTKGGDREIIDWGDLSIPNGAVQSGEVVEPEELSKVLIEFRQKTNAEHVRLSLPEEKAYLFETEIKANTPIKEIRSLLEFRLEENVPIPSRDVFFDYAIIQSQEERRTARVAVTAYSKETIQSYYDVCLTAGLRPLSFEVEAQAMARSVIPNDISGATMLVDFGKTRTGIGIIYEGVLLYTSTIDIGGNELSRVLRQVLGTDVAEGDLTVIKNTQGLNRRLESTDISDALLSTVSIVKDEIATRMQYWHTRTGDRDRRRIKSIFLCGGSSNLKGLPTYLSETLGVPCARGNVWENAFSLDNIVPPIDKNHSLGYATAIGLALKNIV